MYGITFVVASVNAGLAGVLHARGASREARRSAVQGLALSAAVAMVLCLMWRSKIPFELKAAALATGALLVTPYLFLYDLVVLAVSMAFVIRAGRSTGLLRGEMLVIGFASFLILIFPLVSAPVGLAAIFLVAFLIVRRVLQSWAPAGSPAFGITSNTGKGADTAII